MIYYVLLPEGVKLIKCGDIIIKNVLHFIEKANPPTITNEKKEKVVV